MVCGILVTKEGSGVCMLTGVRKRMGAGTEAAGIVYIALASLATVNSLLNERIP